MLPPKRPLSRRALLVLLLGAAGFLGAGCARATDPAHADVFAADHCTFVCATPAPALTELFHPATADAVAGVGKPVGYIATKDSFHDYELSLDLRWTGKPGNGGVLLALGEPAADKVWPRCVQVQFKAGAIGELIPMDGFPSAELAPGAKSVARAADVTEAAAGEWNSLRIRVQRDVIECWVNEKFSCRITHCGDTAGRLGLQFEGAPFEYRHVALTPIAATAGSATPGK